MTLREVLSGVPDATVTEDLSSEMAASVAYLESDAAARSLEKDPYWPKWDSPWWHMLALWELGEARRIPARAVQAMVDSLNAVTVRVFPIRPEEWEGTDPRLHMCHCGLGSVHQVLTACGVDVPSALPWAEPWFPRYQMADGGLSCDNEAYLAVGEVPSSMVGTIAPFEAMLAARGPEAERFVARAADFLIGRELRLGSSSVKNAEERDREPLWLAVCFPRFYFYDVLRGLVALVRWAAEGGHDLPRRAVERVVEHLARAFPDGVVRLQRQGFAFCERTLAETTPGVWERVPTSRFPLLDAASAVGRPSAVLTRQWGETRRTLHALLDAGRVVD